MFCPIYIDFDYYSPYSGAVSDMFEKNINAHIQCDHTYPYSKMKDKMLTWINKESWEMTKDFFPEAKQVNKCPRTTVFPKETKKK